MVESVADSIFTEDSSVGTGCCLFFGCAVVIEDSYDICVSDAFNWAPCCDLEFRVGKWLNVGCCLVVFNGRRR